MGITQILQILVAAAVAYLIIYGPVHYRRWKLKRGLSEVVGPKYPPGEDPFHPELNPRTATIEGAAHPAICDGCLLPVSSWHEHRKGQRYCFGCEE